MLMLGCFAGCAEEMVGAWSCGLSAAIPLLEVFSVEAAAGVAGREEKVVPVAVSFSLEAENWLNGLLCACSPEVVGGLKEEANGFSIGLFPDPGSCSGVGAGR
ncbi:hypothetical protein FOCG_01195 [Fusarium oxysporum f. sp. radicis-lycopersici 26381]|uniref:Uncharacterized protein n=1 Tax=Fusarium oxysporum Fo47 TaxID=660027 RepID=W9KLS3_FUSOX|nr:hypothetical protein FOZG_05691 [Fusarium oxysporum Fo47]EWZ97847.1 hypothetical protein FOWG_02189 [Fusarium oxysporum f. sp. lycopersici MN25]EXL62685.1 hypothetical protein FOCG_01195 [Fusarium oxysporum f. sp. radicis-lycopersici 26381]